MEILNFSGTVVEFIEFLKCLPSDYVVKGINEDSGELSKDLVIYKNNVTHEIVLDNYPESN